MRHKKLKKIFKNYLIVFLIAIFIFSGLNIQKAISATETRWADMHIAGNIVNPDNALSATNGAWAGEVNTATSATSRYSMGDPSGTLSGIQTISVLARKGSNSKNPTVAVNLYENGIFVQAIASAAAITSTAGQTVSGTFDASAITNGNNAEIEIVITGQGGSGSAKNSAQIDSIEWLVQYTVASPSLTVGVSGSQTAYLDSGSLNSYPGGAFTFFVSSGTANVTSIKISNNGTAGNFSDIRIFYDTDGTYSGTESCFNALCGDGQGGSLGTSIAGSLAMTSGNTYFIYAIADIADTVAGGLTADLQITNPSMDIATTVANSDAAAKNITGLTAIRPNVTDATDSVLADGGRNGETFTITGAGFGTVCASVSVQIAGLALICNSASNTAISATIPSSQTAVFGGTGANGLLVTVGGTADDARSTYYIYPNITSVSTPGMADAARESESITLNGTRFDTNVNQGTVSFTGGFGSVSAAISSWSDTGVTVAVPAAIADNIYTGDITLTRAVATGSKNDAAYGGNVFRILPKIFSTAPVNLKGGQGDAVSIAGDHLCQSGICPALFSAANSVNLAGGSVTSGSSIWTDVSIPSIVLPGTATDGALNITSDTSYVSNDLTYDIKFAPTTPANGVPAGQSNIAFNPTINSSAFSDGTDGDTHLDSEWQIDEEGTFALPEWSETLSAANISVTVNNANGTFAGLLSGQTSLVCGKTYSFRVRHKDNGGITSREWSGWSAASTFNTVFCGPDATSVSNSTEGTLNDGGRIGQTIVISGAGFGAVSAGSRANCAGGAGTGCVKIGGTGGQIIADSRVAAWSDASIAIQLSLTDLAAAYGGAATNGLIVYAAGVSDANGLTFYIYPDIASLAAPLGANTGAREYAAADTDGIITITGNKFGTGPAGGAVVIVGGTAASFIADASCDAADGWAETCIKVQVPSTISDSADSGYVIITQGAGTGNKTTLSIDAESAINIWPRVTGIAAASFADGGFQDGTFTLSGSHFGVTAGTIGVNGAAQDGTPVWGASSIAGVGIPNSGTDSGSIILTKADAKTSNSWSTFYIYPQITGYTAAKANGDIQTGTISVSGNHFGTSGGNAQILINSAIPSATTPVWGATSITNIDIPNTGADSGIIKVTNTGTNKQSNDSSAFYIYPQITSVSNCENLFGDTAREYSASDAVCPISGLKDGEIHINGNHFGSAAGAIAVLGASAPAYVSWGASLVSALQVPTAIPDNSYTGNIVLTRADSASSAYSGFRIAPRIVSFNPASGAENTDLTVIGNHFCQAGSVNCPNAFSYITPVSNVKFGAVDAMAPIIWNWTNGDSSISGADVKVPAGSGTAAVKVISGAGGIDYESNVLNFSYVSAAPTDPTGLNQFEADGVTPVSLGGGVNSNSVILKGGSTAFVPISMILEVEVKQTYLAFDGMPTASSLVQGPGAAFNNVAVTVSGLTDGLYHWRARAKNINTGETSNWISFGGNIDGETDFYIDTAGPLITGVVPINVSDIQATIIWSTDGSAIQQAAYGTICPAGQADAAGTFNALAGKQPLFPAGSGTTHSVVLSGLTASTGYYYMVRSADMLGNYSYDPASANFCNNFTTDPPRTRVMKTLEFYIEQLNDGAASFNKSFDTFISESKIDRSNIFFKSVIVEVFGVSKGGGGNIIVSANLNGAGATAFTLADPGANSTYWAFDKNAGSLNFDCVSCTDNLTTGNTLDVSVSGAASTSLLGAKAIITYYYEPL